MKKFLHLSFAVVFSFPLACLAQISILSTDMPAIGDTLVTATDTNTIGMTIGSRGANRVWDFSNATPDRLNTNYILNPSGTPYAANFPTANRAGTENFTNYVYTRVTGQKYEIMGATVILFGTPTPIPYNPTNELYRFPTQYEGAYSSNWGFQFTTPWSSLPPNVQADISAQLPAGVTISEFRIINTASFTDTIDGWGTTITPVCSYNSLRQKRVETGRFVIDARTLFFGIPSWTNVIDSTSTTTTYNWLAKETKLPLVTAGNLNGVNIGTITYSLLPPTLTAGFAATMATSVCPGGIVSFADASKGCPDSTLWSFPGGTPSTSTDAIPTGIVYNTPGNYSVTLTIKRGGETATRTLANYITVFPNAVAQVTTDTICTGETGTLIASGGTSYLWNTGGSTPSITDNPTANTSYSVTVTNSNTCTATASSFIRVLPVPVADVGENDTICQGQTGTLVASGGVNYLWNTGANSSTLNLSASATTNYTVTVTDANGCSSSASASIVVKSLPLADAGSNDIICRNETGSLTASGGVSYIWSSGNATAQISVTPTTTTNYVVTVTGSNGCSAQDNALVIVNQLPVINLTDVSICSGSTTVLDAGNPGASYLWSNSSTTRTISVSTGGTYAVSVTDNNNCSNSDSSVVTVAASLTVNPGNPVFCQGDSAVLDAGNPGTTHVWSTGASSQTITIYSAGTYDVTVTDALGCVGQGSGIVTVNLNPVVDAGENDTICAGETVQLVGVSTGNFLWSTGDTATSITLSPTLTQTYSLQVSDANNCVSYDSVIVEVNVLPVVDAGANDSVCLGETGILTAIGNGTFLWNTNETTASVSHLPTSTTTYSVILTDANNCTATDNATIFIRQLPVADAGQDVSVCAGEAVTLVASGGVQYLWSNGQTSDQFTLTPDSSTAYEVTATDVYGCESSDTVEVIVFALPQVSYTGLSSGYCPNVSEVTLTGIPSGGSFSGTAVTGNTFAPQLAPAGVLEITYSYTDANNCSAQDTQQVEVYPETSVNFSSLNPAYCINALIDTLAITPTGGILAGAGISGNVFNPAAAGGGVHAISYTRTDTFGCFYSDTATVTVTNPVSDIQGLDSLYCSNAPAVVVTGVPFGGTISGPGVTDSIFNPAQAGTGTHVISYTNTVQGCTGIKTRTVRVEVCTSIEEVTEIPEINIYPNPAADKLFIDCDNKNSNVLTVSLTDVLGKVVYTSCCQQKFEVDLGTFSAGLYFATVKSGKITTTKKVILTAK